MAHLNHRRGLRVLYLAALIPISEARGSVQDPDCLAGLPTLRQGLQQLQMQNLRNPQLEQQLKQLNDAMAKYASYSPQLQNALNEAQTVLNEVPPRVCSEFACVDLSGVKGQTQSAINDTRTEWSRIGNEIQRQQAAASKQQQSQAQNRAMQAADRAAEQLHRRNAMLALRQRCRDKGGDPDAVPDPKKFWVQPKLQPVTNVYGRFRVSSGFRELMLPPGYVRPKWPPANPRLPGYPAPQIREKVGYPERIKPWTHEPPAQFGRRAGGPANMIPNPLQLPGANQQQPRQQQQPNNQGARPGQRGPRTGPAFQQLRDQMNNPDPNARDPFRGM